MKSIITLLILIYPIVNLCSSEIEKKIAPSKSTSVPFEGGSQETVFDIIEYYRNEKMILREIVSTTSFVKTDGSKEPVSVMRSISAIVDGKPVAIFDLDNGELLKICSKWPIFLRTYSFDPSPEKEFDIRHIISVPEAGFVEMLKFKDGKLLPLPEGEGFLEWSKEQLKFIQTDIESES